MNLSEFREHCYHSEPQSLITTKLQWDCLILKLKFLRRKKIAPVCVPYAAVKKAITVCQYSTILTHPSDDQLHYRWGQRNPVQRWRLAHIKVPCLCKLSSLCGLHPSMCINMGNSYFRISSVEVGKHISSLVQDPGIEERFWKTGYFALGWRESYIVIGVEKTFPGIHRNRL